jgi:hypothetical protein
MRDLFVATRDDHNPVKKWVKILEIKKAIIQEKMDLAQNFNVLTNAI